MSASGSHGGDVGTFRWRELSQGFSALEFTEAPDPEDVIRVHYWDDTHRIVMGSTFRGGLDIQFHSGHRSSFAATDDFVTRLSFRVCRGGGPATTRRRHESHRQ